MDAVEFFKDQGLLRQRWRQLLKGVADLERLTARTVLEQATPRDVVALKNSARLLPTCAACCPRTCRPWWPTWPRTWKT